MLNLVLILAGLVFVIAGTVLVSMMFASSQADEDAEAMYHDLCNRDVKSIKFPKEGSYNG